MNNLLAVVEENNLSQDFAKSLQASFTPLFDDAKKIAEEAKKIVVTKDDQLEIMQLARSKRLELKNIRVEAEKKRKELKEESLRTGKAIDGMANIIKFLIVPIEEHLQLQEDFLKIKEEKRLDTLAQQRIDELATYNVDGTEYDLRNMSDTAYDKLLENSKIAEQTRIEALKKEEEERIEAEKKRVLEEKRIREENEKLKLEAIEREKKAKIEAEKRAKERAKLEEKLRKESEARRKLQEEARKKEIEEKRIKEEAEQKAKEEELEKLRAEKEARLAPDKEKMRLVYKSLHEFHTQFRTADFQTKEALDIFIEAMNKLTEAKELIAERMKRL